MLLKTGGTSEQAHPLTKERLDMRRIIDSQVRSLITAYRLGDASGFRACVFQ